MSSAKNRILLKLAPLAKSVEKRQEHEELVLRYFSLVDQYPKFKTHKRGIGSVLDEYMEEMNHRFNDEIKKEKKAQFEAMLGFVQKSFRYGFSKGSGQYVSRVFFEALSVGVHLAMRENPSMKPRPIDIGVWLNDYAFYSLISGKYKTHTPDRMKLRIEYVKAKILKI